MDYKIKAGDKIKIRGDKADFTDHLDGEVLTVLSTEDTLCEGTILSDGTILCEDKDGDQWYVWEKNIVEVICDGNV